MGYFNRGLSESEKGETKLVGSEIPTNIFYYLTLFCLVDNRSKSSIVRPLIEEWAKDAEKKFTEKQLIEMAANKGYESYAKRKNKRVNFANVLKSLERELKGKGISEKHIDKIIKKIEDVKSKENKNKKG